MEWCGWYKGVLCQAAVSAAASRRAAAGLWRSTGIPCVLAKRWQVMDDAARHACRPSTRRKHGTWCAVSHPALACGSTADEARSAAWMRLGCVQPEEDGVQSWAHLARKDHAFGCEVVVHVEVDGPLPLGCAWGRGHLPPQVRSPGDDICSLDAALFSALWAQPAHLHDHELRAWQRSHWLGYHNILDFELGNLQAHGAVTRCGCLQVH